MLHIRQPLSPFSALKQLSFRVVLTICTVLFLLGGLGGLRAEGIITPQLARKNKSRLCSNCKYGKFRLHPGKADWYLFHVKCSIWKLQSSKTLQIIEKDHERKVINKKACNSAIDGHKPWSRTEGNPLFWYLMRTPLRTNYLKGEFCLIHLLLMLLFFETIYFLPMMMQLHQEEKWRRPKELPLTTCLQSCSSAGDRPSNHWHQDYRLCSH